MSITELAAQERTAAGHFDFSRAEWAALRQSTPMTLTAEELTDLQGLNEALSVEEIEEVYLPLSRLLNLYVVATQGLHHVANDFLGREPVKSPYVIGIAGSVAVGKSTTARVLRALLSRWENHLQVALVTTDGFLYPNAVLRERNLMDRKGFPESYDVRRLIRFLDEITSGHSDVEVPKYSHLVYDVLPDVERISTPDILIVEGLNVLQSWTGRTEDAPSRFVADFLDFTIYLDADHDLIRQWYVDRFLTLRRTAFRDPASYFHKYSRLSLREARKTALDIWDRINSPNLAHNIAPTRSRAHLVLQKGPDHRVDRVRLRKL
ncbi:pantothenate kinase [Lentzea pudingi]|uniref:Pantothenate kinase n=1 Tax=Lentzea pudingi TaxID=1789439 RepID=A0ABQ2HVE2_9PSEU|nr:pantothenate kinase [Lentzea pudingi]